MREIKFRAWAGEDYIEAKDLCHVDGEASKQAERLGYVYEMFTGLLDKNGVDIYEGDVVRFTNKWEWYRGSYAIKMMAATGERLETLKREYEAEPYEERAVSLPDDYEWLLSQEIQQYWEVVGNVHENQELLT